MHAETSRHPHIVKYRGARKQNIPRQCGVAVVRGKGMHREQAQHPPAEA